MNTSRKKPWIMKSSWFISRLLHYEEEMYWDQIKEIMREREREERERERERERDREIQADRETERYRQTD